MAPPRTVPLSGPPPPAEHAGPSQDAKANFQPAAQEPATQPPPSPPPPSTTDRISAALVSLLRTLPAPPSPPSCSPPAPTAGLSDRPALIQRLRTFRASTWFGLPPALDALECARQGWVNTGRALLACQLCKQQVAVSLPSVGPADREKWDQAVEATAAGLKTRHRHGCPWQHLDCPREVLGYPSESPTAVTTAFASRVKQLLQVDYLPDIDQAAIGAAAASHPSLASNIATITAKSGLGTDPKTGAVMMAPADPELAVDWQSMLASPVEQTQWRLTKQQKAVLLALFGWTVHLLPVNMQRLRKDMSVFGVGHLVGSFSSPSGSTAQRQQLHHCSQTALQCPECHARVGLWQFFSSSAAVPAGPLAALRHAAAGSLPDLLPDPLAYYADVGPSNSAQTGLNASPGKFPLNIDRPSPFEVSPLQVDPMEGAMGAATPGGSSAGGQTRRLSGVGSPGSRPLSGSLLRTRSQLRSTIAGGHYASGSLLDFTALSVFSTPRPPAFGSNKADQVFGLKALASNKRQKMEDAGEDKQVGAIGSTASPPGTTPGTLSPAAATKPELPASAAAGPHSAIPQVSASRPSQSQPALVPDADAPPSTPAVTLCAFNNGICRHHGDDTSTDATASKATLTGTKRLFSPDHSWLCSSSSPPPSRQRGFNGLLLDPVSSHRHWCPFVCGYGTEPSGWACTLQSLSLLKDRANSKADKGDPLERAKQLFQAAMRLPGSIESTE